jgi:hypothetical protein
MKKFGIIITLFISSFITACTYDTIAPEKIEVPEMISFNADVIPIFDGVCNNSGCHSDGGISPNLTEDDAYTSLIFFGYVNTDVPEESEIYLKITTGSMTEYASDQDRAIILKWIEQGALDN